MGAGVIDGLPMMEARRSLGRGDLGRRNEGVCGLGETVMPRSGSEHC